MSDQLSWLNLPAAALTALARQDVTGASAAAGLQLPPDFVTDEAVWLWRQQLPQPAPDASIPDYLPQAVASQGQVIGYAGFQGRPDATGRLHVVCSVDEAHRRRGHAKAMLQHLLERAAQLPAVRAVRASVGADNPAARATLEALGFRQVGGQWNELDELELVFERAV